MATGAAPMTREAAATAAASTTTDFNACHLMYFFEKFFFNKNFKIC
jgi:hypothetical protein